VSPPTRSWSIVEFRGQAGLEQLEDEWRRLYAGMPNRSRYHVYEALRAFVDHLCAAPEQLRCLALTDGERVRAICPLERRVDMTLAHPITVLASPWHLHWLVSDAVCPEDDARRRLLPAIIEHLRQERPGRRLLLFGPLPRNSVLWEGLEELDPAEYCTSQCMPSCVFDCERSFDEIQSRLKKHFRRNLRSHHKKLLTLEDVEFATVTDSDRVATELAAFMDVEASGWKGVTGTGSAIRLHPRIAEFYGNLAAFSLGSEDRCEINTLCLGERHIASQFCVRTGRQYTILKICYDQDFAHLGPGQLLLEQTLQRCCDDPGIGRLDLVSDAAWCEDWQPEKVSMQQAHIALGRWSGRPPIALLRARYGPARSLARWLRAQGISSTSRSCKDDRSVTR
jgi:Acetyltransferase (GNAT) domain